MTNSDVFEDDESGNVNGHNYVNLPSSEGEIEQAQHDSVNDISFVSFEDDHSSEESRSANRFRVGVFDAKPSILVVLPSVFLAVVCSIGVYPMLPTIQTAWFTKCDLDAPGCEPNYEEAQKWAGIFDSIQNLCAFCVAPQLGRLSDAIGRKPLILLSSFFVWLPVLALWMTNTNSPSVYYSTIVFCGVFGTSKATGYATWNAYIADISTTENRSLYFGYLGAMLGISMVMTPLLNLINGSLGSDTEFLKVMVLIGILNTLYVLLVIPESLSAARRNNFTMKKIKPQEMFKLLKRSQILAWTSLVMLLGVTPEMGVAEIALIYVNDVYSLKSEDAKRFNATYFAILGGAILFTQLIVVKIFDVCKVRYSSTIAISQMANAVHMLVYASLHFVPLWAVYLNTIPTCFVFLSAIGVNSLITDRMGKGEYGFAMGCLSAVSGISGVIGPLMFSQLFAALGKRGEPYVPFLIGSAMALCGFFVTILPVRRIELSPKRLVMFSHSGIYSRIEGDFESDESEYE